MMETTDSCIKQTMNALPTVFKVGELHVGLATIFNGNDVLQRETSKTRLA